MLELTLTILATGAEKMAQTDPHGWTLTLISVSVVFSALIILYGVYSLIGKINMDAERRKGGAPGPEEAAAIAMALEAELGSADEAAIALALHLYLSETVHDTEPGVVTIRRVRSAWNDNSLNFRKTLDR
jgi:Na+-transporting methylmalonyl-CoA/oxaloacetate decarboxylase gamma subunit